MAEDCINDIVYKAAEWARFGLHMVKDETPELPCYESPPIWMNGDDASASFVLESSGQKLVVIVAPLERL